ncbi:MBL fold metallo-hydrolase [Gordonia rubripertincta]|uniref:MBL fold metallo-hydrolase n=1 Tax=Gordonia rubripertincta TaxID=36822 RepID=UPI0030FEFB27
MAGKVFLTDAWVPNAYRNQVPTTRAQIAAIKPSHILIGHGHFDHAADAPDIAKASGARLVGSAGHCAFFRGSGVSCDAVVAAGARPGSTPDLPWHPRDHGHRDEQHPLDPQDAHGAASPAAAHPTERPSDHRSAACGRTRPSRRASERSGGRCGPLCLLRRRPPDRLERLGRAGEPGSRWSGDPRRPARSRARRPARRVHSGVQRDHQRTGRSDALHRRAAPESLCAQPSRRLVPGDRDSRRQPRTSLLRRPEDHRRASRGPLSP